MIPGLLLALTLAAEPAEPPYDCLPYVESWTAHTERGDTFLGRPPAPMPVPTVVWARAEGGFFLLALDPINEVACIIAILEESGSPEPAPAPEGEPT